jgi:ZIP family zinc transporter
MDFAHTLALAAVAGFTIYLGLPFARLKNPPRSLQAMLNAIATGILVFLLWDILTKASEPIESALQRAQQGDPGNFILLLALFALGFGVGLLGLVYFEQRFIRRAGQASQASQPGASGLAPIHLAMMIAIGIGLHNFSEGLAIGQASSTGAISLATILIVGFGLHNTTEGFGIAAPMTAGARPSWGFLALAGLIAGGPTFLGSILGYSMQSEALFVLCLALAAGSILYVVSELLNVGRRFQLRELVMLGVFLGFIAGYGTDLILTWGGA